MAAGGFRDGLRDSRQSPTRLLRSESGRPTAITLTRRRTDMAIDPLLLQAINDVMGDAAGARRRSRRR